MGTVDREGVRRFALKTIQVGSVLGLIHLVFVLLVAAYESSQRVEEEQWRVGFPSHHIHAAVAFTPDNRTLVSGGSYINAHGHCGEVLAWDTGTGRRLWIVNPHEDTKAIAVSPDGRTVASLGYVDPFVDVTPVGDQAQQKFVLRRTVQLWDRSTGKSLRRLLFTCQYMPRENDGLTFSPSGRTLAVWQNDEIILLDTRTGKQRDLPDLLPANFRYPQITQVAFTATGDALLVAGTGLAIDGGADALTLSDVHTGNLLRTFDLPKALRYTFALSPNGARLVVLTTGILSSTGSLAMLFDTASGKSLGTAYHHSRKEIDSTLALAPHFLADGKTVAVELTQDRNNRALMAVCNMTTRRIEPTSLSGYVIGGTVFSSDGKLAAAGGDFDRGGPNYPPTLVGEEWPRPPPCRHASQPARNPPIVLINC